MAQQLDLFATAADLKLQAEQLADPPIVRSIVNAATAKRPRVMGPASVFDLGMSRLRTRKAANDERAPAKPEQPDSVRVVSREGGIVRCKQVRYADTEEGQEKERARRAKQRPPRPTKAAAKIKMKGSREWADKE
ncbi:hypothetical protein [Pseudacidovorax intermedius]|uniref:Uncharacterized protein n=1 Tax=Pseudacidovorax intermedius TaxID=433924 RepID=A0A147GP52_9BURK|nr:hypothetical protein [Pseudacidovorax intermedius]KTT15853.1 hypothetical protein NS331_19535 [Pseudacidovorax intermedius]